MGGTDESMRESGPGNLDDGDGATHGRRRGAFTDSDLTAAWARWAEDLAVLLASCTASILERLRPAPGERILDLASGTGDPALALARAVAPDGQVVATDIALDMLRCARQRGAEAGLYNLHPVVADAGALGFSPACFDAAVCRFGIMFFVDPVATLSEIRSLLRPGGRVLLVAWGSPKQPYFACTRGIVEARVARQRRPDGLDTFRFAAPGSLTRALEAAGFADVREEAPTIQLRFPGPPMRLWRLMQELTASFQVLANELRDEWDEITGRVLDALAPYVRGDEVVLPGEMNLALARC